MTTPATKDPQQLLYAAIVAAQSEMPAVEKDAVNPHFKSRFTSLDHLIAKTRPVLAKHVLGIVQAPTHLEGQPALATTVLHEAGGSLTETTPLILQKNDMQGLGAALTYAKRYAWSAACGVSTETDDDGEGAGTVPETGRTRGNGQRAQATDSTPDALEALIARLNKEGVLGETEIRDGMQAAYGTSKTTELKPAERANLAQRLAAKAGGA